MSQGAEIDQRWNEFEGAIARRAATSTRDYLAIGTEQFRGIMREVVKVTPPGHAGLPGGTREAMKHGEARVASDIRSLYGSPSDAYQLIQGKAPQKALSFWFLHNQGQDDKAAQVFQAATGQRFSPFDGGVLHRRMKNKRGTVARVKAPVFYVRESKLLSDYIEETKTHVMFLTGGWKQAFAKLGLSLPNFITRHDSPGDMLIEISDTRIHFLAADAVQYAALTGLQRRIQFAIDAQTGKMNRQWDDWQAKLNRKAGL